MVKAIAFVLSAKPYCSISKLFRRRAMRSDTLARNVYEHLSAGGGSHMQQQAMRARKGVFAGAVAAALAATLMIPSMAYADPTASEKQAEAQAALASLNSMQSTLNRTSVVYDEALAAQREAEAKRDEAQARIRRSKIQREADFFAAMDGATKFVKGDAIMSLITTLINLVGGVIVGFVTGVGDKTDDEAAN